MTPTDHGLQAKEVFSHDSVKKNRLVIQLSESRKQCVPLPRLQHIQPNFQVKIASPAYTKIMSLVHIDPILAHKIGL